MAKKSIFIGPIIIVVLWWIIAKLQLINPFFFPGPIETISELIRLIFTGAIIPDLLSTLGRVALAFFISVIIGLPLGLILGSSRKIYGQFEFVIDFFRSIPATAMFPLFLLIFGIEDKSKIAVAAFASALIILFNTAYGIMHSKRSRVFAAKLMGASKFQVFKNVLFWESLPQTFIGMRTGISLSLVVIVVTEMFIGTYAGLGRKIIDFQYVYNITGLYAVILLTGILGYLLNLVFILIEKKVIHWAGK